MAPNPGGLKRQKMCDETKPLANSRGVDQRSLFLLAPFNSFRMWKTRPSVWNWEKWESERAEVPAGGTKYISKPLGKMLQMQIVVIGSLDPSRLPHV